MTNSTLLNFAQSNAKTMPNLENLPNVMLQIQNTSIENLVAELVHLQVPKQIRVLTPLVFKALGASI